MIHERHKKTDKISVYLYTSQIGKTNSLVGVWNIWF